VNFGLADLPRFVAVAGGAGGRGQTGGRSATRGADGAAEAEQRLRGRIVIAPGVDWLDRAHDAATFGRLPEAPILEATIPSLIDPRLIDDAARDRGHTRPPIRHVMSVLVHDTPYALRDGDWDHHREPLGDLVQRTLEPYAPGFGGLVTARQVITPLDLERTYGLTGGHPDHAEQGLDQWFAWRPLLGSARYRLPLSGLYLCGSGAHPGGGVTGAPGENAAREILADWRSRRR
jgi:phytoene dehydrogenase-like protein